ncbi:MAG: DUF6797 domain-containing protein [Balneolales bacterium]
MIDTKYSRPAYWVPALTLLIFLMLANSGLVGPQQETLHIHFISASKEYQSQASLKAFGQMLERYRDDIKVTASWGEDAGSDLPDIQDLEQADLMVVFARRMTLPDEQLGYITRHVEANKPVLGIRTASHAFQGFLELDEQVFGGDYDGHGGDEPVELTLDGEAEDHPILSGVGMWTRPGKIYHNPELGAGTQALIHGRGRDSGIDEPLAWTNRYGQGGRAFYTSMGMPADFKNEHFLRMLYNAVLWTTGREGGEQTEPFGAEMKPGYYQRMDYGPVLAETIRKDWPENSLVRKGLAIRLDHDAAMVFDTDLMRFATATAGGWLDITKTDYTGYKGSDIASLEGRQIFASPEIAGWAREGSFYGPRQDGMGNLPRDWARYQGYYRNGDQVVLSYTVGGIPVLDQPGSVQIDGTVAFTRTLQVDASDTGMQALIAGKRDSWTVTQQGRDQVILDTGEGAFAVHLTGEPGDGSLSVEEDRIELHFQPSDRARHARIVMFEMASPGAGQFGRVLRHFQQNEAPDLNDLTRGGQANWEQELEVAGHIAGGQSGYVIDRIPIPFENPWGAWMRLSGLDFFEDGRRAAVSTWNGDVWIVSGLDGDLEHVTWRRFASGLFYPMGIAVVDEEIFVTERSQLTRLHDLNGNGEADFYENFNNDGIVYPMAHSLGLEVDSGGNFYFFKNGNRVPGEVAQHGALIRVSADGASREVYARGYRGGNTLGIGYNDRILSADQEGNWVPVDRIDVMEKGGFYGDRRHGGTQLEVGEFNPPIAWTPKQVNNSSGLITWAGDSRWGPLAGQWILGSYGQSTLFAVLTEQMGDRLQGGVVKLPVESASGLMRGAVSPADGQLYVAGLRGWQTLGTEDAAFERIRYAGGKVNLPRNIHITPAGVQLMFTDPVDPVSAQNINNYRVERWDYLYSSRYGSPEVLPDNSRHEGRDTMTVTSVTISDNGKAIFMELEDMRSVMQMKIAYELTFNDGQKLGNAVYHTVNWLSSEDAGSTPGWQQRIIDASREPAEEETGGQERLAFEGDDAPAWFRDGAVSFERNCVACHVSGGVAPTLATSEWAGGSREALVRIVLHGKRGNRGVMTPFSWMDDHEVASVVSYIRRQWHGKEPVSPSDVGQIRKRNEDRTGLWTEEELREF